MRGRELGLGCVECRVGRAERRSRLVVDGLGLARALDDLRVLDGEEKIAFLYRIARGDLHVGDGPVDFGADSRAAGCLEAALRVHGRGVARRRELHGLHLPDLADVPGEQLGEQVGAAAEYDDGHDDDGHDDAGEPPVALGIPFSPGNPVLLDCPVLFDRVVVFARLKSGFCHARPSIARALTTE